MTRHYVTPAPFTASIHVMNNYSSNRWGRRGVWLSLCGTLMATNPAQALPLLSCDIEHTGARRTITQGPVHDPYRVTPVDIDGRFRFKAVVAMPTPEPNTAPNLAPDYVTLSTYYWRDDVPVLLHEAKYLQPTVTPPGSSLTGRVRVYAPPLGRELIYTCRLGVAP